MILFKTVEQEYIVDFLRIIVPVRYEEEDIPNDFPGRENDILTLTIDLETGHIREWNKEFGKKTGGWNLYMKVCDGGIYQLIDNFGNIVDEIRYDYVPSNCGIGSDDYIEMNINKDGYILKFKDKIKDFDGFNNE